MRLRVPALALAESECDMLRIYTVMLRMVREMRPVVVLPPPQAKTGKSSSAATRITRTPVPRERTQQRYVDWRPRGRSYGLQTASRASSWSAETSLAWGPLQVG